MLAEMWPSPVEGDGLENRYESLAHREFKISPSPPRTSASAICRRPSDPTTGSPQVICLYAVGRKRNAGQSLGLAKWCGRGRAARGRPRVGGGECGTVWLACHRREHPVQPRRRCHLRLGEL